MGGWHGAHVATPTDGLLVLVDSPVHRLPAHGKILALLGFVLVVVATPAGVWWAFVAYAVMLLFTLLCGPVCQGGRAKRRP